MVAARTTRALLLLTFGLFACGDDDEPTDAGRDAEADDGAAQDASGDAAAPTDSAVPDASLQPATVETSDGPVRGTVTRAGALAFYGIPYAAPPVGLHRFGPTLAPERWTEPLDATQPRASCPQPSNTILPVRGEQSEDCLEVNVFTPTVERAASLPVMVFIHGGAFTIGSGNSLIYDGSRLALLGNVVVTLNYRLGLAGFLAHPALDAEMDGSSGMYGMMDQQAALSWIRNNAAQFGGDPTSITIFGESAGALSVCLHYVMPSSRGLFARAISQSGSCVGRASSLVAPADHAAALARGEAIATALGCPGTGPSAAECLRALPIESLVDAIPAAAPGMGDPAYRALTMGPNVDGAVLPDTPERLIASGDHAAVPYLMGTNLDEGTLFTDDASLETAESYDAWARALTGDIAADVLALYPASDFDSPLAAADAVFRDLAFVCPTRALARSLTAGGVDVRVYQLVQTNGAAESLMLGTPHAIDLLYVFGNFALPFEPASPSEMRVRDTMQGYWTRFAEAGDPNGDDAFPWPVFGADEQHVVIGDPVTSGAALGREQCDAIAALAGD